MSRTFLIFAAFLFLNSCGVRTYDDAPRNLDNACSILNERTHYVSALSDAKRKWGVEPHVLMAMIHQESKFISDNRPPHQYALGIIPTGRASSARGYSQALDGTWEEYQKLEGGRRAQRNNFADATDFMGWYMNLTVKETGVSLNDTRNQYLAYHEGRGGFNRGSYRKKPWLVKVSTKVANRAAAYQRQLADCRAARNI